MIRYSAKGLKFKYMRDIVCKRNRSVDICRKCGGFYHGVCFQDALSKRKTAKFPVQRINYLILKTGISFLWQKNQSFCNKFLIFPKCGLDGTIKKCKIIGMGAGLQGIRGGK